MAHLNWNSATKPTERDKINDQSVPGLPTNGHPDRKTKHMMDLFVCIGHDIDIKTHPFICNGNDSDDKTHDEFF